MGNRWYNGNLLTFARQMRREMTPQESRLWYRFLRSQNPRFQRQKIIGNYIADFYCHKAQLIVEADGNAHFTAEGREYDAIRTAYFMSMGYVVYRVSNDRIDHDFDQVCEEIRKLTEQRVEELN